MSDRIPPELVQYADLVEQIAVPMGLDPSVVLSQIWTEVEQFLSDDDPDNQETATRDERRWRYFYDPQRKRALYDRTVSVDENRARAQAILDPQEFADQDNSWGLMQVMLAVAREYGFAGTPEELCDASVNITIGCMHLDRCLARARGDVFAALCRYNGSPAYARKVLRRWEILKALEV